MSRFTGFILIAGLAAGAGPMAFAKSQAMCPCRATTARTRHMHRVRRTTVVSERTRTTKMSPNGVANRTVETTTQTRNEVRYLTIPAGTAIPVRLDQALNTRYDKVGAPFVATVTAPVMLNGMVAVPRGATCRGHLVESKPSGRLKGRAHMRLRVDTIEARGRVYTVAATGREYVSKNHKKHDLAWIGGGAGGGAAIGAVAGGGVGAAVGAGAGAVVGTTGAVITGKRQVKLAAETPMVFTLRQPITVRERVLRASR